MAAVRNSTSQQFARENADGWRRPQWRRIIAACCVCAGLATTWAAAANDGAPAWPVRITPPDQAGGIIVPLEAPHGLRPTHTRFGTRPTETSRAAASSLLNGDIGEVELRFEGPGAFIYTSASQPPARGRGRAAPPQHDSIFKFISGRMVDDGAAVKITRTWFAWYDAAVEDQQQPRGTVLLMPGMLGTPEPTIELFITHLRDSGYGVLRMMCQPSRFTERITFEIDMDDPQPAIRAIAAETSQRLAECAYAVEAAFAHVEQQHPDRAELPRIALGMSGGAMILPTVVAREPDRYAAAILIAGGANLMSILELSNYRQMIGAADIRWKPGAPDEAQRKRIEELYLQHATLDAWHTARYLRDTPVLMIHGSHDMAVPAHLGDLLWERLGQPERWVQEAGHELLFIRLPRLLSDMLQWLDANVQRHED